MSFRQMSNLNQRFIVSGISAVCLLALVYVSHTSFAYLFGLLAATFIGSAVWEYYTIAKEKGFYPLFKIGLCGTVLYTCAIFLRTQFPAVYVLPGAILGLTLMAAFTYYFIKGSDPFVNLAITLFGIAYLAIPLSCLVEINYFEIDPLLKDGRVCLVYLICVTKLTDTFAFFVGKKFGKHQLSPYISPKKTWEGAIGGLCGALFTSLLFYLFLHLSATPLFDLSLWQSIWLACLISITAQFGDLAESLLKRDVGIKDSNRLPGLGGILDMVDSLVFTSPLMYFFLKIQMQLKGL